MLTVTADNSAFKSYLDRLQNTLGNLTPAMRGIGMEMEGRVTGRFETKTDPDGLPWHPWARNTDKYYPRAGTPGAAKMGGAGNGLLMDRYGELLKGISYQADSNSVRIGSDQLYSTFHEFGTKNMPRRGLFFSDPEKGEMSKPDEEAVLGVLYDLINNVGA